MRSEVLVVWLLGSLPLCLAGPPLCSCNGYINSKGQGECQTTYRGKQFCYVNQGNCNDQKKVAYSYRYWSYEACKNYHTYGLECYGLKGDRCQFPFKWDGRTFSNCTTYKSANGAAWCATRVRGHNHEAVCTEYCSAPCDHGASPYEDCPRNPVVEGRSQDCCTPERPCRIGEGDCDSDADCGYGLKCGNSNCAQFRPDNYARADCCYDPKHPNYGKASCWYDGRKHEEGETFPAKDRCNDCVCESGDVICSERKCYGGHDKRCNTVGGADPGSKCIFPFTFDGIRYSDCTKAQSYDGKEWCSTKTDYQGHHIGGQGNWGHCPYKGCTGGRWSTWGSWSSCNATCGGGERSRVRRCSGGGCSGSRSETIRCNTRSCCDCGSWGAWGRCSGTCGERGTQSRSRSCRQRSCSAEEFRSCTSQNCELNCKDGVRVRKNVNSLSRQESRRLVSALQSAISRGEYQKIANFHGFPTTLCGGQPCCPHLTSGFLPWHRLFMVHMEEELGEALPYWDWTEDRDEPSLWAGIRGPIQPGLGPTGPTVGYCSRNGLTSRSSTAQIDRAKLKAGVQAALMEETFEAFWAKLSGPHDDLHVDMGCDMSEIGTAAYDPLFYLHHTYVDYVFAYWQELQRIRGHNDVPFVRGLTDALAPFNDTRHNSKPVTLRNNRGNDTFEYSTKFCYEYQDMKFDGLTPREFHQTFTMSNVASKSQERIWIGVILPKTMPSGYTTFDLCLAGRCVKAGKVTSFGSRCSSSFSQEIDSSSHRLREVDVTDLVEKQGWDVEDNLQVVLTSILVAGLPTPVIVRKFHGLPGEVQVPRGQTLEDYGDLLDSYSIVDDLNSEDTWQVIVSGKSGESGSTHYASMIGISNIELFPRPPSACSIPDLPQPRSGHSLSLLSEKLLVACGAYDCISWVAGNQSWTHLYTMSVARSYHTAWTPPSRPNSIVLLGGKGSGERLAEILPGGETFALRNSGYGACGITDGETIVLTGGFRHNFVTRYNVDGFVEELPQMPTVRMRHACGALPTGEFVVAGGFGSGKLSSALMLLPGSETWVPLASLPRALDFVHGSIVGGKLRLVGGRDDVCSPGDPGDCGTPRYEVLEYSKDQWSHVGNLTYRRYSHATLTIGPQQLPCLTDQAQRKQDGSNEE